MVHLLLVAQFVNDHEFDQTRRCFDEPRVEKQSTAWRATSKPSLHSAQRVVGNHDPHGRELYCAFGDNSSKHDSRVTNIPIPQAPANQLRIGRCIDAHHDSIAFDLERHTLGGAITHEPQEVLTAEVPKGLARLELGSRWNRWWILHNCDLLLPNPRSPLQNLRANQFKRRTLRSDHLNTAIWQHRNRKCSSPSPLQCEWNPNATSHRRLVTPTNAANGWLLARRHARCSLAIATIPLASSHARRSDIAIPPALQES